MAGEVLLGAAAEAVLGKLISVVTEEINLARGFKTQLKTLSAKSTMILTLLHDAGRRQMKGESVTLWLQNLKNVAYDADDVLDDFAFEMLRRKLEMSNRMRNKASNFFSVTNPIAFRFKMAHKVKQINMILDQVVEQGTKLGLHQVVHQVVESSKLSNNDGKFRQSQPFITDSKVFGRDADKSKVVSMLLQSEIEEALSIVAIVGLGGVGKTTLTQLVYNDESVTSNFSQRIWVCVSNDFNAKRILKEMTESLTLNIGEMSNIEAMVLRLMDCNKFEEFPEDLANLVNLRHLYFNHGKMPSKMGQLTCLQTLPFFSVRKCNEAEIEELGSLSKLRGKLELRNLKRVRNNLEARRANLSRKANVYMLTLAWIDNRDRADNDEDVLEGLQPPPYLKSIIIQNFLGGKFASWMLPQSLVQINLINCKECEQIPTLGNFPL